MIEWFPDTPWICPCNRGDGIQTATTVPLTLEGIAATLVN